MTATQPGTPGESAAPVLTINLDSPVPPYEQLREQIAGLIGAGELKPGARLPPVRQLAADLGIAGGTVARAYRELD
jgi:DNA-binding transcriptional regulator YhcF (GntR family)